MPLEVREVCGMCRNEVISEKMGVIACRNCLPKTGKINFKNQQERADYYKEKARSDREKKLPRVCPRCEKSFLDTRSWVIRADKLVVCRGCNYQINLRKGIRMEAAFDKAFTSVHITRFTINGAALRDARRSIGVSMKGIADRCGWNLSYINELECGDTLEISEEAYLKIVSAFEFLRTLPDYDVEIAELKIKQKKAKKDYGKKMGIKNRGLKFKEG